MTKENYTLPKLLELIDQSEAYKTLSEAEKSNIQEYIKMNDVPVLTFIFHQLLEEQQINELNRQKLAQKISTVNVSPEITKDLKNLVA